MSDKARKAAMKEQKKWLRRERRKLDSALLTHKERRKKLDWIVICAMAEDLVGRYGRMDASALISELGDKMGDIGTT